MSAFVLSSSSSAFVGVPSVQARLLPTKPTRRVKTVVVAVGKDDEKQDKAMTEEKAATASSKKEAAKKAVDAALKEATAAAEESEASKTSSKVRDGVGTRAWLLGRHRWEVR